MTGVSKIGSLLLAWRKYKSQSKSNFAPSRRMFTRFLKKPVAERIDVRFRGFIGTFLFLTGVVWIAQGLNALHGSMGRSGYAVLGAAAVVCGGVRLAWTCPRRRGASG
jgi:hypothetical protein